MKPDEIRDRLNQIDVALSVFSDHARDLTRQLLELRISIETLSQLHLQSLKRAGMSRDEAEKLFQQERVKVVRMIEDQEKAARKAADESGPPDSPHAAN